MQKLDDTIEHADLQTLVNELEQKVNTVLSINKHQAATIKRLQKENIDLKKQLSTTPSSFGLNQDQLKEITNYIAYIDECIKALENQKSNNE